MDKNNTAQKVDSPLSAVAPRTSEAPKFFRIRELGKYQHYKKRNPPWVKLHGELLENYEFQQLPDATRFHALWLIYLASRTGNKIPNDPDWVASKIGARSPVNLNFLWSIDFLEPWKPRKTSAQSVEQQLDLPSPEDDASTLLASCYQNAIPETETEAETEAETHTHTAPVTATQASLATQAEAEASGVCVSSRYSFSECLSYVEHLRANGQGITNPGGLATKMHQTGYADAEIDRFLNPPPPPPKREFIDEPCPTCLGTTYQNMQGKGVRPCPACRDERGTRTGRKPKDEPPAERARPP